jgi:hypothetical protein
MEMVARYLNLVEKVRTKQFRYILFYVEGEGQIAQFTSYEMEEEVDQEIERFIEKGTIHIPYWDQSGGPSYRILRPLTVFKAVADPHCYRNWRHKEVS